VTNLGFAPPDWLLFVRAGILVAQRLDVPHHRLSGDPIPLGEQIALVDLQHGFDFSVSKTGSLVYRSANPDTQLTWFDRSGKRLGTIGEPARYGRFELSPDERQIAFERYDADLRHGNLWLLDLVRGAASRLTSTASSDYAPSWSPDGRQILFGSARKSSLADIYEIGGGGTSPERLILHDGTDKNPMSWSSDGRFALIMVITEATREDIWKLPLDGSGKAAPLVATRFSEVDAQISPDGRWFAYASDESGRYEVYVQSLADASRRYRVSTSGGGRPRWRRDGKELFFGTGAALYSVAIEGKETLEVGAPQMLFRASGADYAVARDGRILAAVTVDDSPLSSATVVLNWTSELPK
jgi:Tol biopolymer transport system component